MWALDVELEVDSSAIERSVPSSTSSSLSTDPLKLRRSLRAHRSGHKATALATRAAHVLHQDKANHPSKLHKLPSSPPHSGSSRRRRHHKSSSASSIDIKVHPAAGPGSGDHASPVHMSRTDLQAAQTLSQAPLRLMRTLSERSKSPVQAQASSTAKLGPHPNSAASSASVEEKKNEPSNKSTRQSRAAKDPLGNAAAAHLNALVTEPTRLKQRMRSSAGGHRRRRARGRRQSVSKQLRSRSRHRSERSRGKKRNNKKSNGKRSHSRGRHSRARSRGHREQAKQHSSSSSRRSKKSAARSNTRSSARKDSSSRRRYHGTASEQSGRRSRRHARSSSVDTSSSASSSSSESSDTDASSLFSSDSMSDWSTESMDSEEM